MEKTFDKNGNLDSYNVGGALVHKHIHYPGEWRITIRKLDIFNANIGCKDTATEKEVFIAVSKFITTRKADLLLIIAEIENAIRDYNE